MSGDVASSFIQSLYVNVRGRYATDAEIEAGLRALRTGRPAVVGAPLRSPEYRQRLVRLLFASLHYRTANVTQAEVDFWVRSGQDSLRIRIGVASTQFNYENG